MKNSVIFLAASLFTAAAVALSPEAGFAKKFVDDGLEDRPCKTCISSEYMSKYGLTTPIFSLNGYSGAKSSFVSENPPYVTIEITTAESGWSRHLTYKVVREGGKLAIAPPYSPWGIDLWVDPWVSNVITLSDHQVIDPDAQRQQLEKDRAIRENADKPAADVRQIAEERRQKADRREKAFQQAKLINSAKIQVSQEALFARKFVADRVNGTACHTPCISKNFLLRNGLKEVKTDGISQAPFSVTVEIDRPPFVVLELRDLAANEKTESTLELYRVEKEGGRFVIVPKADLMKGISSETWVEPRVATLYQGNPQSRDQNLKKMSGSIDELQWSSTIREGSQTNCGPVLEVRNSMVKVYFPVANYGNEHWIDIDAIRPAGAGCRFVNGRYAGAR